MESHPRMFALVIGIDKYKTGSIWNLESCVDDAHKIERWLQKDLGLPKNQIWTLTDKHATKQNIEQTFSRHFLHNERIQEGDAILIYFACRGSTFNGTTEVLCTYDCGHQGIQGITDYALHGMVEELAKAKGTNITVMLDSCFSPTDRGRTRWTPLNPKIRLSNPGSPKRFYDMPGTLLVACGPGERSLEGKDGGKFTSAFLETARETALHATTFPKLIELIRGKIGDCQRPALFGADHLVFNGVPFPPDDVNYIPADHALGHRVLCVHLGSLQGVVEGTEFSVHRHNCRGSINPVIAQVQATDVYPSWSFGQANGNVPYACWVQVKHWNHLRLKPKRSFSLSRRASRASLRSVGRTLFHRNTY